MTLSFAPDAIETWPLSRLQPYARNAKAHGADQVAKIAASMAEFGWTVPCLVGEDGELIAGHGRVLAATQLGLTEAPVIVLGHLTEAQRRAYRIADNKLTELGTWDEALLSAELNELLAEDFDLSLVGFSDGELDKLLAFVPEGNGEEGGAGGSVPPVTIPEPPRNPASPWPASLMRCPSSTPGGIRTLIVRVRVVTPVPLHSSQGFSMIDPLPRHSVHGSENPNAPWLRLTTPAPLQLGHTFGLVPGRAPLPWQLVHGAGLVSRSGIATPLVASRKLSSVSVSRSFPRRGRDGRGGAGRGLAVPLGGGLGLGLAELVAARRPARPHGVGQHRPRFVVHGREQIGEAGVNARRVRRPFGIKIGDERRVGTVEGGGDHVDAGHKPLLSKLAGHLPRHATFT